MQLLHTIANFDQYLATASGKIYSIKNKKYLKPQLRAKKYYVVHLRRNGKTITIPIHRIICLVFKKKVQGKDFVNHIDGNKLNNNDWNLEWSTEKGNQRHAVNNNLHAVTKGYGFGNVNVDNGVHVIDIVTGEKYKSISDAAKKNGKDRGHLGECLNGIKKNKTNLRIISIMDDGAFKK